MAAEQGRLPPTPWVEEIPEEPVVEAVLEGLREEASRIAEAVAGFKEVLGRVRQKLKSLSLLKGIKEAEGLRSLKYLALDTGFTSPALELIGGRLIVIIRAHITNASVGGILPASKVGFIKFVEEEGLVIPLSKIIEREFILNILKLKKEGRADVDVILIDGELFPRTPSSITRIRASRALLKLYGKVLELTEDMLDLADRTNTALAGVIKRAYGSDLQHMLREPKINLNDKALATYILNSGEWISMGTYRDISYSIREYLNLFKDRLSEEDVAVLKSRARWIESICSACEHAASVRVAIYKARTPTYFAVATRAELWPSEGLALDDLVSYLASLTGINGVPHPIDLVDGMCRVRSDLLNLVQQRLQAELTAALGDPRLATSIVGLTNPEKMGLAGFR